MTKKTQMRFNLPKELSSIIKIIGVGGGGSNAVNYMYKQGINGVDFIVCNTDHQALDISSVPTKIQLGSELTEGRGAGSNPEIGRNAAIESINEIKSILEKNTKMLFITAGMGGGTGTGASPVIAQAAKEMDILTVGIVTYPFSWEGKSKILKANEGIQKLKENVDTLLVICNDKLREMYGELKFSQAFAKADDVLLVAVKSIAEIITITGYVNVDFEDVKTVMKGGGTAIMGLATAEGENRAIKAVSEALSSPLLNDNNIKGAKHILLNISSGTDEITIDEISEITDYIQQETGEEADIIWGNNFDEELDNKIKVTIIATGFKSEENILTTGTEKPKKIVKPLEVNEKSEQSEINSTKNKVILTLDDNTNDNDIQENDEKNTFFENSEFPLKNSQKHEDIFESKNIKTNFEKKHKRENEKELNEKILERMRRLEEISKKMKQPKNIIDLENEPAFIRRNVKLDDVPDSSEDNISRFTLDIDEENNEPKLRPDNPFLHDNVD